MSSYKYLRLVCGSGISLLSSDEQTLEWIIAETKKLVPKCNVDVFHKSGGMVDIDRLNNKDYEIGLWIIQALCQQGWEPFAVTNALNTGRSSDVLHFRYKSD